LISLDNKIFAYSTIASPIDNYYTLDGLKVKKIDKMFVVTDYLNIREKPNVKSKLINLNTSSVYRPFSTKPMEMSYFLKGLVLNIDAESFETSKINSITAHWYRFSIGLEPMGSYSGWIFGAYLKPYQEDKSQDYRTQLMLELKNNNLWNGPS